MRLRLSMKSYENTQTCETIKYDHTRNDLFNGNSTDFSDKETKMGSG